MQTTENGEFDQMEDDKRSAVALALVLSAFYGLLVGIVVGYLIGINT